VIDPLWQEFLKSNILLNLKKIFIKTVDIPKNN
jgi:hypothetical protein